jgi:hypothetical protein
MSGALSEDGAVGELPAAILLGNCVEFTSKAPARWVSWNHGVLDTSLRAPRALDAGCYPEKGSV